MATQGRIQAIVTEVMDETPKVKRYRLIPKSTGPLPKFSAGAHITTYLAKEEEVLERHYSLTNNPRQTEFYEIAINRNSQSKGGSEFWHDHVQPGQELEISFPKNQFSLSYQAKHHVFFAAGIGITPFLAMAAELKAKGKSFELHYAASSMEACPYYEFLKTEYQEQTYFYFSKESQRMQPQIMNGQRIGTHVYFCGPDSMIRQFSDSAKAFGYPEKSIHYELFTPPDFGPAYPFQVKLTSSDQVLSVAEDESLLEVLLKNGIQAPFSCKVGGCGSCEVGLLEGKVDHRDIYLTEKEKRDNNVILTCVSRGKKECLVLDL